MELIGKKSSLHFFLGGGGHGQLQEVGIFYQDLALTPVDKMAYLPQFSHSMSIELEELRSGKINPEGFFLDLGPTTDDCSCRIELAGEKAKVSFDIDGYATQVTNIPIYYLISVYEEVITKLEQVNTQESKPKL